jgi:hypothetical protein
VKSLKSENHGKSANTVRDHSGYLLVAKGIRLILISAQTEHKCMRYMQNSFQIERALKVQNNFSDYHMVL